MTRMLLMWLATFACNALVAQVDVSKEYSSALSKALVAGNATSLRKFLHDSTRLMPEFQKTIIGKEHALAYYDAFLNRFTVTGCTRERVEWLDLGSQQVELGTFSVAVVVKSTQKNLYAHRKIPGVLENKRRRQTRAGECCMELR